MTKADLIMKAVADSAVAKESKAIANLKNYLENSVGVGEHPDIVAECAKLVKEIADARETLSIINSFISIDNETTKKD